jgi:hypothetical protein
MTKWKFFQLDSSIHTIGNTTFQLLELEHGFLYRWMRGGSWYSAQVINRKVAWVIHQLVERNYLDWAMLSTEKLV